MNHGIVSLSTEDAFGIVPQVIKDWQGFLMEAFRMEQPEARGFACEPVKDSDPDSVKGILRGLLSKSVSCRQADAAALRASCLLGARPTRA